jgi:hypothetical protein
MLPGVAEFAKFTAKPAVTSRIASRLLMPSLAFHLIPRSLALTVKDRSPRRRVAIGLRCRYALARPKQQGVASTLPRSGTLPVHGPLKWPFCKAIDWWNNRY